MSISTKKSISAACAAILTVALLSSVQAASITYSINNSYSSAAGGSLVGTLTTDGTIGTLSAANITDFSLNASIGAFGPASFLYASSNLGVSQTGLTADANNLYFDFTPVGVNGVVDLKGLQITSGTYGVFSGPNGVPIPGTYRTWGIFNYGLYVGINTAGGVDQLELSGPFNQPNPIAQNFYTSKISIGTASIAAVPVPSALLLFGTGFLALAFKRQKSKAPRA
jgi:hypothetical protein